jgi:hypothetical protein
MSDTPSVPGAAPVGAPPGIGAMQRLLLMFTAPVSVFEAIVRKPTIAAVLIAVTIVSALAGLAVVPKMDVEGSLQKQISKAKMSDEQAETMIKVTKIVMWVSPAASVVTVPIVFAITAGLYFLGLKLVGSKANSFPTVLSAILHASWPPLLVKCILIIAVSFTLSKITADDVAHVVKSNLGSFLPAGTPKVAVALGDQLDAFAFWHLALVFFALVTVGKISEAKAAGIALFFFGGQVALAGFFALLGSIGQ